MKNHAPLHPALDQNIPNPLRRRGSSSADRKPLGLRGTVHGPQGQSIAAWVIWTAGDCAELALETVHEGAMTGRGWKIEIPGLGLFGVELVSARGTTCRVTMSSSSVGSTDLARASVRH